VCSLKSERITEQIKIEARLARLQKVKRGATRVFFFALPFLSIVITLELLATLGVINPRLFPPPSKIFLTSLTLASRQVGGVSILLIHVCSSFIRIVVGFSLAALSGIFIGTLMGTNKIIYRLLNPIITFIMPIPTFAWVPILLIWTGIGDRTIIITIFLSALFAIIYNTSLGVRSINKQLIWAAQTMGSNRLTMFLKVLLPGAMVSMITGLRLGLGYSWRALVAAEMLAAAAWGLGYMVFAARAFMAVDVMFVGLFLIMIMGYIMENGIMGSIQKITIERWGMTRKT